MSRHIEQVWFEGSGGDRLAAGSICPVANRSPTRCSSIASRARRRSPPPLGSPRPRRSRDRRSAVRLHRAGASEGDFANTNFSSNVEDIVRAADALRDRGAAPKILVGHSLGGAAVLAAAAEIPEAVAVATIGAPFDPAQLARLVPPMWLPELDRADEVCVEIGGRRFPIRRQLLDDVNAQNLTGRDPGASPGAPRLPRT